MPTLKAIHIAKSRKSTHTPKLVNKYVFANAQQCNRNEKAQGITKAIRNLGIVLILKLIALNKIIGKLKVNRFKIPNYA